MTLIDNFDRGVELNPEKACFIVGDTEFSYQHIQTLTHRVANKLNALGISEGKQGGVLSINDPVAFACVLGIMRSGSAWTPINPKNSPQDNLYLCNAFDVEILFYHSIMTPMIEGMRPHLTTVKEFVCIDKATENDPMLEDWLGDISAEPIDRHYDPESTTAIIGTGGTTGQPKGVMLSHRNAEVYVSNHLACAPTEKPPVNLAAAPLTHAAGVMLFPVFVRGGTTIIMPMPDLQQILQLIEKHKVTELFLPPTIIYMLLAQPNVKDFNYSSLQYFVYGGAPMSVAKLKESIETFGPVMTQFFGQSEAPMSCTFMGPKEHLDGSGFASDLRLSSCGRPTPFVKVAIMDDEGNLLTGTERGEIVVRSSLVMKGYYKNPEATAEASLHGWHHTGDIGYRDEEGYFHIVDRKKDMIITGGFNVFSSEVEQSIFKHPAVQDCAVVGVPDEKWGESIKAIVQLQPNQTATEEEIIEISKEQIGSVKAPKTVEFWTDLPRSSVGKVLKAEIRSKFWEGQDRSVN